MIEPKWQLAEVKSKNPDFIGKLIWVELGPPELVTAGDPYTLELLGLQKLCSVNVTAPLDSLSIKPLLGAPSEQMELLPIFATDVKIFDTDTEWIEADNKTIFEMGTLIEDIKYEDFQRTLSN